MPINTKQMGLAMNAWQAMTPEQQTSFKPQMRQMMDEYRVQQQEAWSRARSYYTAADHGLGKERFDELTGKLANATDPEKSRQSLFNDELVSLYSGIPANMLESKRGGYMQAIAEKELGHQGPIDDAAFFSGMQGLYKMEDEMQAKVLEGAVAGQSAGAIWQGLSQANAGKPGWKQKERDYAKRVYLQAHELKTMADRLRPTAERLAVLLSTAHTPAEVSPELRSMRGMSDKELAMVYELVASQSKPAEGAAAELGQAYHDAGIDLFHQVNRNAHLKSLDDAMAILDADAKRGIRVPEGLKNAGEIVSYLATQGSYDRPLPESMGGDRQAGEGMRLLSSDEIARVKTEAQEMRGDLATLGKFEKFADEKRNPTSDNGFFMRYFALPAARSLPITLSAAAGGLGLVAATRYYEQEETDRLVSLGVPYDKAKGNALAVGISQAIAERFQAKFLLGKMPGTKKALDVWMKPGGNMALRGAGYLGANVAGETSIELLQDFIIPAAVQDITQVGGDVTWLGPDGVVQTALNAAPETAAGVFLFGLMGSGIATISDIKGSEQMVKDRNLLLQTGYSEEQASEIAAIQDPKAALARAGELWGKRSGTKETMTKAANAMRQQVQQSRDSEQELEQLGLLPIMGRQQDGAWYVRGKDGAAMPFGSYEEANAARWQEVESRKVGMHQAIRETLEMDERKLQPGEETKQQFSFREITQEQQVAAAPGDAQTLERRKKQSDVLDDGYEMEAYRAANAVNNATATDAAAQEATALVIGRSYTEFADGIRRRVMELNQGATPLTVVEESVEDDARKLLTSGKRDWLLANLRELEAKIGKLFVTTNDAEIEASDIVEAYSHVAVSYFAMKSRKGEGKFKNNKGWLDEFRAELRTMGIKRLLDATATKLYAMFRRAAKLGRLSQKGQINPEFEAQLAQSLGLEQALHEAGVVKESESLLKEAETGIPASGKSESAFSLAPGKGTLDDRLAKMFDPFQKSPELRQKVGLLAQQRLAKASREWADLLAPPSNSRPAERARLVASLRTLDAILSTLPSEVRGKIGGYVQVAKLTTDEARLKEIESRVQKMDRELEKWLRKDISEQVEKLFDRFRPSRKAGEKPKGKLGADAQEIVDAAESAMKKTPSEVDAEVSRLESLIEADDATPEFEARAKRMQHMIQLFGDWKNADAARMSAALEALRETATEGWAKWKLKLLQQQEERAEKRSAAKLSTGKTGSDQELSDARDASEIPLLGTVRNVRLNLSSFAEVMGAAFGDSDIAREHIDRERDASNGVEDEMQSIIDGMSEFFAKLGGSTLKGEQIVHDLNKRTIKTSRHGKLSEFEAIQALLMWRQPEGRKHMEGRRDENNRIISPWGYDQDFIDELEDALSENGRAAKSYIESAYASEYSELNALYRERHGISLPQNALYAPLTVEAQKAKKGEVVDPFTGQNLGAAGILSPSFLKTRSLTAVARPRFRNALQVMIEHKRMLSFWKHYYELATDAKAILSDRDVLDTVAAKGGEELKTVLKGWVDYFAQGGVKDATANLAINRWLGMVLGNSAQVALFGRATVVMVQSTQLAAALVKMPVGAYLMRFSKLMAGQLSWGDAVKSDFMQRRLHQELPIIRVAMQRLGSAVRPNIITHQVRHLGNLINGSDVLFTSGTYAILLDYHRSEGVKLGMTGEALEAYAHNTAARDTEAVAQPTRAGARSLFEVSSSNPLARAMWAFASESRQKLSLLGWAASKIASEGLNSKSIPYATKVSFLVFVVGGLFTQVIKNLWREAKGDDDEEMWSPGRLAKASFAAPVNGMPGASLILGESTPLLPKGDRASHAVKDLLTEDQETVDAMRDVDAVLSFIGAFHPTAAALASGSHLAVDAAQILENVGE